ncbi:SO_0444 family Cu/Zn efflux transporter [Fodinicurvata sp. EGI_FJ10296]|uniref:SO_0444 family Cu/Zn efflux transporter n=1 Tax=Fodinicurvata sp. EGI_FJ10296 TaxID=3231908 RepID=UPI00345185C7
MTMVTTFLQTFLDLALATAPWLLLGLVLAGLIRAWLPQSTVARHIGTNSMGSVLRASVIGLPLPLCSCGAIPVALELHRRGAGRGPSASFLVATPGIGPDAFILTSVLLGPAMAIARLVGAFVTAVAVGAALLGNRETAVASTGPAACGSCCGAHGRSAADTGEHGPDNRRTPALFAGLRDAVTDFMDDVGLAVVLGLVVAAAIMSLLPPESLAALGGGVAAMLLMAVIGIPMYICAAAATPIAAALVVGGMTPGTALVFLIAGPVTSLATLAALRAAFGTADVIRYVAAIAVTSIAVGLVVDLLIGMTGFQVTALTGAAAEIIPAPVAWLSLAIIAGLLLRPAADRLKTLVAYTGRLTGDAG